MLNYLYWFLCVVGAVVSVWYELSRYTKLTIFSTLGLAAVAIALAADALTLHEPDVIRVILVAGIVVKLTDRIVRKAVCEPRGWSLPMVCKGRRNV